MYTYAFFKTPLAPLTLPSGIATVVQTAAAGQLSAIIEPALSLERLQQDDALLVQAVLAHDRVLRSLFLQTTILPLRFGTCFSSLPSVVNHLHTRQQTYLAKLAQLDGHAEYTLKLTPVAFPELALATDVKGKDYFVAKKQQYQAQQAYQQQQHEAARQIEQTVTQTYSQHHLGEATAGVKTLYLLVAHEQEKQLYQHMQTLQKHHSQWKITLGEALPPYHFVTDPTL